MRSYEELYTSIKSLRVKEHEALLDLLVLLGTFEDRGFYRDAGYSSLFSFLVHGLKYSNAAASRRMNCARIVKKYPLAFELLRDCRVSLTTLSLTVQLLTPESATELLNGIADKSKEEVEFLLTRFRSKPAKQVRESIKPIKVIAKKESRQELPIFNLSEQETNPSGGESVSGPSGG